MNTSPYPNESQAMGDPLASNQTRSQPSNYTSFQGKRWARHSQKKSKKQAKNADGDGSPKSPSGAHHSSSKHGMRWSYLQLIKDGLNYLTSKRTRGAAAISSSLSMVNVAACSNAKKRSVPSHSHQARRHSQSCRRPIGRKGATKPKPKPKKTNLQKKNGRDRRGVGGKQTRWVSLGGGRPRCRAISGARGAGGQRVRNLRGGRRVPSCSRHASKGKGQFLRNRPSRGQPRKDQRRMIKRGATRQPSKKPKPGKPQRRNPSRQAKTKGQALMAQIRQALRSQGRTKGPARRAQVQTRGQSRRALAPPHRRQASQRNSGKKSTTRRSGPGRPRNTHRRLSRDLRSCYHSSPRSSHAGSSLETLPSTPSTSTYPDPTPHKEDAESLGKRRSKHAQSKRTVTGAGRCKTSRTSRGATRRARSPSRGAKSRSGGGRRSRSRAARSRSRGSRSPSPGFSIVTRSMSGRSLDQV